MSGGHPPKSQEEKRRIVQRCNYMITDGYGVRLVEKVLHCGMRTIESYAKELGIEMPPRRRRGL
jgi:hypothetical protein